ncbi:unnamed protein product [Sphacelaria rigidula]
MAAGAISAAVPMPRREPNAADCGSCAKTYHVWHIYSLQRPFSPPETTIPTTPPPIVHSRLNLYLYGGLWWQVTECDFEYLRTAHPSTWSRHELVTMTAFALS